jgi:hypothetical protein
MANEMPRHLTPLEFVLELIHIFIEHNWLILQTVIVSAVLAVSLYLVLSPRPDDDQAKRWAYGSLTTITGVWIGSRLSGRQATGARNRRGR